MACSLLLLDQYADANPGSPLTLVTTGPAALLYLRGTMPGKLPAVLFEVPSR